VADSKGAASPGDKVNVVVFGPTVAYLNDTAAEGSHLVPHATFGGLKQITETGASCAQALATLLVPNNTVQVLVRPGYKVIP
jgi:hypothetical protein